MGQIEGQIGQIEGANRGLNCKLLFMKDEAKTRIDIDTLLQHCGFVLQDKGEFNRFVRDFYFRILW